MCRDAREGGELRREQPCPPAAEQRLWEHGVLCVPDFVANSGGVLGGTMEFAGWRPGEILDFFDRRFRSGWALIRDARRSGNLCARRRRRSRWRDSTT